MLGTFVNAIAVVVGCAVGLMFKKIISKKISETVFVGLALCTLYIGVSGAIKGQDTMVIIISMIFGGMIGEWLDIDTFIIRVGESVQSRFNQNKQEDTFAQGFISASLLFCVGAMTILGSLQSGLSNDHQILFAKSALDFVAAIIYSSTLGIGVGFSALFILLYQGSLTMMASYVAPYLSDVVINEMNAVGSIILIGLALTMLKTTKLKIANFIPAIFMPIIIYLFI
ncbi:MAG: DUF554 domain-containing protein [Erysipelotrichaceae bacterium]|nr:DUF554 domain-containing protein [Erysipelotrichaceae bacterium]MDD3923663.1 DUF554 domain-containing protein [Erysipelotrichaceae bacterium]MDD4642182.1 DUF554 domain-containing protein [Erysipelotrichaceae bacterium]